MLMIHVSSMAPSLSGIRSISNDAEDLDFTTVGYRLAIPSSSSRENSIDVIRRSIVRCLFRTVKRYRDQTPKAQTTADHCMQIVFSEKSNTGGSNLTEVSPSSSVTPHPHFLPVVAGFVLANGSVLDSSIVSEKSSSNREPPRIERDYLGLHLPCPSLALWRETRVFRPFLLFTFAAASAWKKRRHSRRARHFIILCILSTR